MSQKQSPRCAAKKLFQKILQYSQENTCFFNKVAGLHNFLDTYYKITVIRKLTNGSLWNHEHKSMQIMYVFINQFLQQATWLKGQNSMCIFAVGRVLESTQEEKTIRALVERIHLIIVSREGNHAQFELLSKIFESFNVMGCIPPPICLWACKERHNLCMNHASLDCESLDRVLWTSTTPFQWYPYPFDIRKGNRENCNIKKT